MRFTSWVTLKKVGILLSLGIVIALIALSFSGDETAVKAIEPTFEYAELYAEDHYHNQKKTFPREGSLTRDIYDGDAVVLEDGDMLTLNFELPEAAAYTVALDYKDTTNFIMPSEIGLKINGDVPFAESENIKLSALWNYTRDDFPLDRYDNEVLPRSVKIDRVQSRRLFDTTGLNQAALLFPFEAGDNTLEITLNSGAFELLDVHLLPSEDVRPYEEVMPEEAPLAEDTLALSATDILRRNNSSIRLTSDNDPSAERYAVDSLMLNAVEGASFRLGNDTIVYEINVETAGYYHLGVKYRQDYLMQMPAFRELRINGEVPFEEAGLLQFHSTTNYQNLLFGDPDPYLFYLDAGTHELSLRAVMEPYRDVYHALTDMMQEISDLSLEVKKLTGNSRDPYRTWDIERYIPDAKTRLEKWENTLMAIETHLSGYSYETSPGALTNLRIAREHLETLGENVNSLPSEMLLLADGNTSASQMIGSSIQSFLENGLDLQSIYVKGEANLPRERASIFTRAWVGTYRFFESFGNQEYQVNDVEEGVLEVWINHPRQYLEIIQTMVDRDFTAETGIEVEIALMPDENKLILANAAENAPDVAVGVNHWIPYELAIRGASMDLRQFDGYEETVGLFKPGVMVPYAFEEGIYGLPETQNFWVTYYREDVLESLEIPVPETWEEVIEILPEMQRFDMNYYEPLAFFKGFKPFVSTMPFIYQFGGQLYSEDGMSTVINSEDSIEGITLMSELFTVYNLPKEVPNFYQHFRYGTMPIGISDLSTYLQLSIAAPEIAGKWNIAPHPGVMNESGEVERWAASGAQSSMIMQSSEMPDEAWEFLSWWMSTESQTDFAIQLQTTYGTEYLWNTANIEAFQNLPLPKEHIETIMSQWDYALEASRVPGAYMVEREISNAWNQIVFDDANPRITLDDAVRIANREIRYKMEEFDYVIDGAIIKPYKVPTIYNIQDWLTEHDE